MSENNKFTEIAKQAMQQMNENKGPGQKNGNKNGYSKAPIANPSAKTQIHKLR